MIKKSPFSLTLGLSLSTFLLLTICLKSKQALTSLVLMPRVTAMGQAGIEVLWQIQQ